MKIPHRKRRVTTITLDPEIVEKAKEYNLNISRLSEDTLKETINRLEREAKPMGAPVIKRGGEKEMTRKVTWVTAAILIIAAAAVGTWAIFGGAPGPGLGAGNATIRVTAGSGPFSVIGAPPDNSGIENIYILKSNQDYTQNFSGLGSDNVWGTISASGGSYNITYNQSFAICVAVTGTSDNMGSVSTAYLKVALKGTTDSGTWSIPYENTDDNSTIHENAFSTTSTKIRVNAVWDNNGNWYKLRADDNLNITNVDLWLRG